MALEKTVPKDVFIKNGIEVLYNDAIDTVISDVKCVEIN